MSFSMSNIARKIKTNEYNIGDYGRLLNTYYILPLDVKDKLFEYAKYRLYRKRTSKFSVQQFDSMIKDLLEFIINKSFKEINGDDVINNQEQIIDEITKSICKGTINSLYYKDETGLIENYKLNTNKPKSLNNLNRTERNIKEDYYRGMMI